MNEELHAQILHAHANEEGNILVALYSEAANEFDDIRQKCFFLTQAYIFALETNHAMKESLRQKLAHYGSEPVE